MYSDEMIDANTTVNGADKKEWNNDFHEIWRLPGSINLHKRNGIMGHFFFCTRFLIEHSFLFPFSQRVATRSRFI